MISALLYFCCPKLTQLKHFGLGCWSTNFLSSINANLFGLSTVNFVRQLSGPQLTLAPRLLISLPLQCFCRLLSGSFMSVGWWIYFGSFESKKFSCYSQVCNKRCGRNYCLGLPLILSWAKRLAFYTLEKDWCLLKVNESLKMTFDLKAVIFLQILLFRRFFRHRPVLV